MREKEKSENAAQREIKTKGLGFNESVVTRNLFFIFKVFWKKKQFNSF